MKKHLLLFFGMILTVNCYSQISFEKGYYINNSDEKIDCLIKNTDWRRSPVNIEYKLSENNESKNANIKVVKEFGIYNVSKYIRRTVNVDNSSENFSNLSNDKNPIFIEKQLFLKVLIEGKSNLYEYLDDRGIRYFYNIKNSTIEQLIHKSYKTSDNKIGKNNRFRQQLWKDLKCSTIKMNKVENLVYEKNSLVNFFIQYNKCVNANFINYKEKQKRDLFNLTLRPRMKSSSLSMRSSTAAYKNTDFGSEIGFGFGIEAEFILPFNKNKWGILVEPTYQNFKSKKTTEVGYSLAGGKLISEVNYNSIEIPLGLRHYLFLNNNSKVFINASFIFDSSSKSSIEFKRDDNSSVISPDIKTSKPNLAFGIGYKLNDKFGLEMRYQTSRELFENDISWSSDYKTLSIIFGYSIF